LEPKNVIEGKDLENINDVDLARRINDIMLFARVTPGQKQRIISFFAAARRSCGDDRRRRQ